jgi:hypothetical protein
MADVKVVATVDGYDNLSNRQKSFINFFMNDAKLKFHGIFNGNTLDHYTAHIQSDMPTLFINGNDINNNPDYSSWNDGDCLFYTTIPFANESASTQFPASTIREGYYIDIASTLSAKTSKICLAQFRPGRQGEYDDYNYSDDARKYSIINNDISLQTVDATTGTVVTSETIKPTMTSANPDFTVAIAPQTGQSFDYTFDYKTDKIRIKVTDGNNDSVYDVFYKIGFVTLGSLTDQQFTSWLNIGTTRLAVTTLNVLFGLDDGNEDYYHNLDENGFFGVLSKLEPPDSDYDYIPSIGKLPKRMIAPVKYTSHIDSTNYVNSYYEPNAIMFFELYKDDNGTETVFDETYSWIKSFKYYNGSEWIEFAYMDENENYSDNPYALLGITAIDNS